MIIRVEQDKTFGISITFVPQHAEIVALPHAQRAAVETQLTTDDPLAILATVERLLHSALDTEGARVAINHTVGERQADGKIQKHFAGTRPGAQPVTRTHLNHASGVGQ